MENKDNDTILNENSSETEGQNADTNNAKTENTSEAGDTGAKINELNDKYLRLYSEFDNYRKRTQKEKADIIKSAGEDVFKALLPVIDDFERAMKANEQVTDAEAIKQGVGLIYNKLKAVCTAKGLEAMESTGKEFDADLMEAITHIPSPSPDMKGKVIDDVEKGYKLGDKVIRFAKVVVGN